MIPNKYYCCARGSSELRMTFFFFFLIFLPISAKFHPQYYKTLVYVEFKAESSCKKETNSHRSDCFFIVGVSADITHIHTNTHKSSYKTVRTCEWALVHDSWFFAHERPHFDLLPNLPCLYACEIETDCVTYFYVWFMCTWKYSIWPISINFVQTVKTNMWKVYETQQYWNSYRIWCAFFSVTLNCWDE